MKFKTPNEGIKAKNEFLKNQLIAELDKMNSELNLFKEKDTCVDNVNIEIKLFKVDMSGIVSYTNMHDHRYWLQQAQQQMKNPEDWDTAIDFYTCGVRFLPLNPQLVYNLGSVYQNLGKFTISRMFYDHCLEIKPRWTEALFGKAVTYFKQGMYNDSRRCVKVAIKNFKNNSLAEFNHMVYFKAMCYKRLHKFNKARRDYESLSLLFKKGE